MKHRASPQVKTLTHIYVRDAQKGELRPCWASGRSLFCGICLQGAVRAEIGTTCPVCSSAVERILESGRAEPGRESLAGASHTRLELCRLTRKIS